MNDDQYGWFMAIKHRIDCPRFNRMIVGDSQSIQDGVDDLARLINNGYSVTCKECSTRTPYQGQ